MDAATTAVSGLFYCCSSAAAVVTASDLTTTVVDANSSAKRGPLNEAPFSLYRKSLSCKVKNAPRGCALRRIRQMSQATAAGARMCQGTFFLYDCFDI